jgi:hypothetical protein
MNNNSNNNILVNHQAMETQLAEGVKIKLETFLALTTDGDEWSAISAPTFSS